MDHVLFLCTNFVHNQAQLIHTIEWGLSPSSTNQAVFKARPNTQCTSWSQCIVTHSVKTLPISQSFMFRTMSTSTAPEKPHREASISKNAQSPVPVAGRKNRRPPNQSSQGREWSQLQPLILTENNRLGPRIPHLERVCGKKETTWNPFRPSPRSRSAKWGKQNKKSWVPRRTAFEQRKEGQSS